MNIFTQKFSSLFILLVAVAVTFTACDDNGSDSNDDLTVMETIQVNSNLSDLSSALETTELDSIITNTAPITVFAPNNEALADDIPQEELKAALEYHVVAQNLTFEDLKSLESVETLAGDSLFFTAENDTVTINGQAIITENGTEASNGRIFVIDTVLTTPEAN